MKVDYKQARKFLEGIGRKDRVAIYTHIDLDGLASGILFEDFCKKKKCKDVEVFFLDYYSPARISDSRPSRFNKFLIADLAPSAIANELLLLDHGEVLYTDHHEEDLHSNSIENFVLEFRTSAKSNIPTSRTVYELTKEENRERLWLATLGVLSDRGDRNNSNSNFLEGAYKNLGVTSAQVLDCKRKLEDVLVFFTPDLKTAHDKIRVMRRLEDLDLLSTYYGLIENEITQLTEDYRKNRVDSSGKVFHFFDTKYPAIKSIFANRVASTNGLKVFVFASPREDELISLSARNQSETYDISQVMKDCISGLTDGKTGGHTFAAAGTIRVEDLVNFKERFAKYDLERARIKNDK